MKLPTKIIKKQNFDRDPPPIALTDPHLGHSQFRVLQLQRVNYEIVKNSTQIHFLWPKMAPHLETTII